MRLFISLILCAALLGCDDDAPSCKECKEDFKECTELCHGGDGCDGGLDNYECMGCVSKCAQSYSYCEDEGGDPGRCGIPTV